MVIALGLSRWSQNILPQCLRVFRRVSVGRLVGSDDFSAREKQHEFSRHEHESSHEQHDFSQHGHDFSREQHEQTHVEQSQLPHVCGNTLGESAVGQSSCDSSGVQLVGQSPCGSSEVQLVGRLPARVVELLQSSAVGKPCQESPFVPGPCRNAFFFRADDLFRTRPDFGCTGFAARVCE